MTRYRDLGRGVRLAACALALLGSACEPRGPRDVSFRVMSWNIAFIPDGNDGNDGTWEDDEERAEWLAQKLLDAQAELDADVLVFAEAFNIEAQEVLSRELCSRYPSFVRYLDEPDDDQHQDAGLMLFSRHPFADLDLDDPAHYAEDFLAFTGCVGDDADSDDPAFWDEVGFILYPFSSCLEPDCKSNKGVAAVRITHRTAGDSINVAFSHTQASYQGDDPAEAEAGRVIQFDKIRELVESIDGWDRQRTFVVGDLNVPGQGCGHAGCTLPGVGGEWTAHFDSNGFFGCGDGSCTDPGDRFVESWGFEMPEQDLGRSYSDWEGTTFVDDSEGERLDYVLHNVPHERRTCLQHMRVLRHLTAGDGTPVSDHLPVWAEFNHRGPHCNPRQALPVTTPDFSHLGVITHPRSVQWFLIQQPGTYSFSAGALEFEVYAAADMSYPIGEVEGEVTDWGTVYKLPDPPYYVKVFSADKGWTGDYSFNSHQHQCGPADCCALTPGDVDSYSTSWNTGDLSSPSRWFCFSTDVSDFGHFPDLEFELEGVCSSPLEMILWNDDDQELPWQEHTPGAVQTEVSAKATELEKGRYLVEVHRTDDNPSGLCWASLVFTTDLTYFYPDLLICHDETGGAGGPAEEVGHDDVWAFLDVDATCQLQGEEDLYSFLYDFDEDDSKNKGLEDFGVRKYVRCVQMNLLEEDDIDADEYTFLTPHEKTLTLDREVTSQAGRRTWDGGDYHYEMTFRLSHEPIE